MFFHCYHVGHETADIMVDKVIGALEESGLGLNKLITLSRDNPTVMRALDRKMKDKAEADGNPKVLSFPDYLHPTHTALREGMKVLGADLEKFMVNIHGFFKLSTGRREDVLKIREIFEENDQFFLRFVSSRWLSTGPVAERLVEHWESLRQYFLTFLPSQTDKASKDAMETVRYQEIVQILKPGRDKKNLARLYFLISLCKLNKPFLLMFQSEKPKIHLLYLECVNLINTYMNIVCEPSIIVKNGMKLAKLNLSDSKMFLPLSQCFFGANAEKEMTKLPKDQVDQLRLEFRTAIVKTIKYLVSHFPLQDQFLVELMYLDPDLRSGPEFVKKLVRAADHTGRFASQELEDLGVQLQAVRSLSDLRPYCEETDHLDVFWIEICDKVEKLIGDKPEALLKFIKIVVPLPHSNGFLERGFSDLKRLITGRELLSLESTSAQKTILDFIRLAGGSTKVTVTLDMIESIKLASVRKEQEKRQKDREEEKRRFQRKVEQQQRERKRKFDEEKQSWDEKHKLKAEAIEVLKEKYEIQNRALTDSLKTAAEAKKESSRKAGVCAAIEAQKYVELTRQLLECAQKDMEKLIGKKPKLK